MATGRGMHLTKQVGEYLVAAELGRRNLIATTFTGNVPHFDILAADDSGATIAVQVKAIKGGDWQFDVRDFVEAKLDGNRQVLGSSVQPPHRGLICVFLVVGTYGNDRFFVFDWTDLQRIVVSKYRAFLERVKGVRPHRPDSFHVAVSPKDLQVFEGKWELFEARLRREDRARDQAAPPATPRIRRAAGELASAVPVATSTKAGANARRRSGRA